MKMGRLGRWLALGILTVVGSQGLSPARAEETVAAEPVAEPAVRVATRPNEPAAGGPRYPDLPAEGDDEIALNQPATPTPPTLPETNVVAEPQSPQPQRQTYPEPMRIPSVLSGTIFASPPVSGYNAPTSTVGTMVDTPNIAFPGTINTITRDVIRDQQVLVMNDLIRDIPTAVKSFGADGVIRTDQFFVRGFEVTSRNWRKDGYLDPTYVARDVANIERIDILKGPSSTLYGSAQPTGTFNVTTKRAQRDPFAAGGLWTGSYGLQRYTADVNSPLNQDGSLLFRINTAYQHSNSFRNSVFNERTFVAPTLTWVVDDDTSITWSGEYQRDRFRLDQGVPAINGDPFAISNSTFTGNPSGDIGDYHSYRSTLTYDKVLSDNWRARIGDMSLWYNTPSATTYLDNGTLGANGLLSSPIIPRDQSVAYPFNEQNHDVMETLAGEFDTGRFSHKAVFGAEQDWFITNHDAFTTTSTTNFLSGTSGSAFAPINVGSASTFPLGAPINSFPTAVATQNVFDNPAFRQNRFGFFGQDMIDLTPRLKLLIGGRYDYVKQTYSRSNTTTAAGFGPVFTTGDVHTQDEFNQFSPRVGMTYDLVPNTMSVYWTYARSFTPSIGVVNFSPTDQTAKLLPQIGDIWEGGIKTQLRENVYWTNSGYYITQHNVNVEQFNPNPGSLPFTLTQAGLQRSQGVESSLTGNFTRRWSTSSNFGYNDSLLYGIAQPAIGSSPPLAVSRVRGVPHWTGNIWTRYNFIQTRQRTVGMALGMIYVGQRVGDYSSPLVLPSYNIWDLGFYFNEGRWSSGLVWDNIFNVNYAVSSISQYQVIPGTPSNVRMQVGATF